MPFGGVPLHHSLSLNPFARPAARGVRHPMERVRKVLMLCPSGAKVVLVGVRLRGARCAFRS